MIIELSVLATDPEAGDTGIWNLTLRLADDCVESNTMDWNRGRQIRSVLSLFLYMLRLVANHAAIIYAHRAKGPCHASMWVFTSQAVKAQEQIQAKSSGEANT